MLRKLSGVSIRRVIDRSFAHVPEHAHQWPVLSVFVMGGYLNETELGSRFIAGPSAVLYRARAAHRNTIASAGFEQIEIEFEPAWLGRALLPDVPVSRWLGGRVGAEARRLAQICGEQTAEKYLRQAVQRLIERAPLGPEPAPPGWLDEITRKLQEGAMLTVQSLAHDVKRHPSWLGTAYRRAVGERLQETMARFRVERAACLLRETNLPYAQVALESGFCDQSHMNRTFRRMLRRLPSSVRDDRQIFRQATV